MKIKRSDLKRIQEWVKDAADHLHSMEATEDVEDAAYLADLVKADVAYTDLKKVLLELDVLLKKKGDKK